MSKKEQLVAALDDEQSVAVGSEDLVSRLLTPAEWDQVAGGDGHSQGGSFTQTGGNFTQTGGGSFTQSGGGSYYMHYTRDAN